MTSAIEEKAKPRVGVVDATLSPHPRLTTSPDLAAELQAIAAQVDAELREIIGMEQSIATNDTEIARLKRNRMIQIAAIAIGILIVVILVIQLVGH